MDKFGEYRMSQPNVNYDYPTNQQPRNQPITADQCVSDSGTQSIVACNTLKLLSYNLQVGISCQQYSDYVTQSWRHILPDSQRQTHLAKIADSLSEFDIVALQEVDSGSMRTRYIDQVAFLAQQSGFPRWYHQKNREFGRLAAHSNGLLTKHKANDVIRHKLPGITSGRGALQANIGRESAPLVVLSVHLSLRSSVRRKQFAYISELLLQYPYFVIMGDMNCRRIESFAEFSKNGLEVRAGNAGKATFPSWDPRYHYDQIWVSESLPIKSYQVMSFGVSDHLPVAIEIEIPDEVGISTSTANKKCDDGSKKSIRIR